MKRQTQSLMLLILGGALLNISAFSGTYVNYVKPGFRPLIIGAGVVLVGLALVALVRQWRDPSEHGHEHGHSHGPRVAWLLAVPVFAIVLVAPPALGSFAAGSEDDAPAPRPPTPVAYRQLSGGVPELALGEFIGRAYDPAGTSLAGRQVRLTGFVVPSKKKNRWYVTRMQISCCAADALALKVAVQGVPAPRENSWVQVTGEWIPWKGKIPNGYVIPDMSATDVTKIDQPVEPYE
ncbi:TIGR03943 family protein [Nonomuraea sp. NEAU-A123]|uniref:TIGR03943 family putative permease subunit n=1 Tax=Nonomuraea sp. NEAU-A123 TaxID=2839649 RepID=UPI001BE3D13E|nr:TIGR03943 family protein [Nonomuraea sp. NEAU-A123]MBT2224960.1 TIGR03943 family protein [Nonomuraea sp. NEAU-A123]